MIAASSGINELNQSAMPHVIVKLWPGKSEEQKSRLAEAIAQAVMDVLNYGDESVSVEFEEISAKGGRTITINNLALSATRVITMRHL